jgi:hypothetical protein
MSAQTSKLVFVGSLYIATLFGTLAIGSVAKANPTVNCTNPNNVSCNISSSKGIKSVKIQANTPLGTIDLVNNNYPSCPLSVTVGWDSAYQSSSQQIVECQKQKGIKAP